MLYEVITEQGNQLYNQGKYAEAIEKYKAILETNNHSEALYFVITSYSIHYTKLYDQQAQVTMFGYGSLLEGLNIVVSTSIVKQQATTQEAGDKKEEKKVDLNEVVEKNIKIV